MTSITEIENQLWHASDQLRANSGLTAAEYCQPVLGLIFLCYIQRRFAEVVETLKNKSTEEPSIKNIKRACDKYNTLFIPEDARLKRLLENKDQDLGEAFNHAMVQLELEYPILEKKLPRDYEKLDAHLLRHLLDTIDHSILHSSEDDVFGRIYEYFLGKFAMTSAQEGGEFFTPMCLVQTIVEILKPSHGIVFDPACGSGGMFIQTNYYLKKHHKHQKNYPKVRYFGQEKTEYSTRLCYMNVVVHSLNAKIDKVNTFYQDSHQLLGQCDFVMGNPPFNVDGVMPEKLTDDPRLVFGLPSISRKSGFISNANFLWIQYFYSYLNNTGKAGFVMTTSAPDARGKELNIIKELIDTGHVNAIILIGNKFFYTRSIACTLWFFDKSKPDHLKNKVLMISAKEIYRKVTNRLHDFSPEQIKALAAITDLSRGDNQSFILAVKSSLLQCVEYLDLLIYQINLFLSIIEGNNLGISMLRESIESQYAVKLFENLEALNTALYKNKNAIRKYVARAEKSANKLVVDQFDQLKNLQQLVAEIDVRLSKFYDDATQVNRCLNELVDALSKESNAGAVFIKNEKVIRKTKSDIAKGFSQLTSLTKPFKESYQHLHWLITCFPHAKYRDVSGLCKMVDKETIRCNDWSLNPQRYVGESKVDSEPREEDIGVDELLVRFKQMTIHSNKLAKSIIKNLEDYLKQ